MKVNIVNKSEYIPPSCSTLLPWVNDLGASPDKEDLYKRGEDLSEGYSKYKKPERNGI